MPFLWIALLLAALFPPRRARANACDDARDDLESRMKTCAENAHAAYSRRPIENRLLACRLSRALRRLDHAKRRRAAPQTSETDLLFEHARALEAVKDALKSASLAPLPVTHSRLRVDQFAQETLRLCADHLTEDTLRRALSSYEQARSLSFYELSGLKDAFLRVLAGKILAYFARAQHPRRAANENAALPTLLDALRRLESIDFDRTAQECSVVCSLLALDPSGVYAQMDDASRTLYRARAAHIAADVSLSETTVVQKALALCRENDASPQNHVGYFLLDEGVAQLYSRLGGMPFRTRMQRFCAAHPAAFLIASRLAVSSLGGFLFYLLGAPVLLLPFGALLFSPCALALMARFVRRRFPPRPLPALKMDVIPACARTLVVVPVLVSGRESAVQLLRHLAVLERAGGDEHLDYLLACDYRDSDAAQEIDDADITAALREGIARLNALRPGKFYYFHRKRVFDEAQRRFIAPMRKRGALLVISELILRGKTDAAFAEITFDPASFCDRYPYMLVLDSDTLLPPGCVHRLLGAMEHPLCRSSILCPRMVSAARLLGTNLADLLGGPGGTPIYQGGTGELYQTLCGRGSFSGKGLLRVRDYWEKTAFVPGRYALSHDLLEGELCQSALMENAALFDAPPLRVKPFFMQLERWTRGDWQLLPWLFPRVPLHNRPSIKNPLPRLSRLKMLDNLRRSLIAPVQLALLFAFAILGNAPACLLALIAPHLHSLFSLRRRALAAVYMRIALLPRFAFVSVCAAGRALYRQFVSGRRLLDWTTAQDAHALGDTAQGDALQSWCAAALLLFSVPALHALPVTLWIALSFFFAQRLTRYLDAPRHPVRPLDGAQRSDLMRWARATWHFFEETVTPATHFLPPDNLQIDPPQEAAARTSPTNIALYLLSCVGAHQLSLIEPDELFSRLERTLQTLRTLPKWRGHLYNWYDIHTLEPLAPRSVSSVDSGNYLACLIACTQALHALSALLPDSAPLALQYESLIAQTDVRALYDDACDLFYVSADLSRPDQPIFSAAHYDLIAGESRLFSYLAVARRAVPLRHWHRLSRRFSRTPYGNVLLSWSGTMFEYLMPRLLQRAPADTLLAQGCQSAVLAQMSQLRGISPWGVSESGHAVLDDARCYQYHAFGVPALSVRSDRFEHVIAPYAGALALCVFPHAAVENLRRMESIGLFSEIFGFYEAADYASKTDHRFVIVKSHMAHHQGMLFCAIVNALTGNALVQFFHADPEMEAFSLLLEEQMP